MPLSTNTSVEQFEAVRRKLAALPEFDPPAELSLRVARAHRAPGVRVPVWSAAAVLVLAVGAVAAWLAGPGSLPSMPSAISRFAVLEGEVAQLRAQTTASVVVAELEGELARVDRALQGAYDVAAGIDETTPLWRERELLLQSLRRAYSQTELVVRI